MTNLVELTNAVLLAIFPHVVEFTQAADLPTPTSTNWIGRFTLEQWKPLRASVGLTNGSTLEFHGGRIRIFRRADPPGSRPDGTPRRTPNKAEAALLGEEAAEIARRIIRNLGIDEKALYAHLPPTIRSYNPLIPAYEVFWPDVNSEGELSSSLTVTIDMKARKVLHFQMSSWAVNRPDPDIPWPDTLAREKQITERQIDSEAAWTFVKNGLPLINDWVSRLQLEVPSVNTNDVVRAELVPQFKGRAATLTLANGYWFYLERDGCAEPHTEDCPVEIQGFYSPDTFFQYDREVDIDRYLGKSKYSERQCQKLVQDAVRALGYFPEAIGMSEKPEVVRARVRPPLNATPRAFTWNRGGFFGETVYAEVDSANGKIKALSVSRKARETSRAHGANRTPD